MHRHTQTTIDRALDKGIKINDAMVASSDTLRAVGLDFVETYKGTSAFVQDLALALADYGALSIPQVRGALNVMLIEARRTRSAHATVTHAAGAAPYIDLRSKNDKMLDDAFGLGAATLMHPTTHHTPATPHDIESITPVIPNGYYTVVLREDRHVTFRLETADTTFFTTCAFGTQIVSFLSGADNQRDYTGCAFVTGQQYRRWQRYHADTDLDAALTLLMQQPETHAARYVLESNRCFMCNRLLTNPDSILNGIGPICTKNLADYDRFDMHTFQLARKLRGNKARHDHMEQLKQSDPAVYRDQVYADMDALF